MNLIWSTAACQVPRYRLENTVPGEPPEASSAWLLLADLLRRPAADFSSCWVWVAETCSSTVRNAGPTNGKILAVADSDSVVLWDATAFRRIGSMATGSNFPVSSMAFSPDGKLLALGSMSNTDTVQLWDVARDTRVVSLHTMPAGSGLSVGLVAFSPDGRTVAGVTIAGTALWDVATRKADTLWSRFPTRAPSLKTVTAVIGVSRPVSSAIRLSPPACVSTVPNLSPPVSAHRFPSR